MPTSDAHPLIVSQEKWLAEHEILLAKEKLLTASHDALAAERRRAPWTKVEKSYTFTGVSGEVRLADLFDGRRQLIVYHHMLKPNDSSPCAGCCMVGDQIPNLAHLHARGTSLVFVSRAPIREIESFRKRMNWQMPWFETTDSFNVDHSVTSGFGLNVFYRNDGEIYRTYFTNGRGMETLGTPWSFLDLTPLGRQETWEESPEGTPQTAPTNGGGCMTSMNRMAELNPLRTSGRRQTSVQRPNGYAEISATSVLVASAPLVQSDDLFNHRI